MSPLELVRHAVNEHGELHLDKELTAALIRWLEACEVYEQGTKILFGDLKDALKPLGIALGKDLTPPK